MSDITKITKENSTVFTSLAHEDVDLQYEAYLDSLPLEEFLHHATLQRAFEKTDANGKPESALPQLNMVKKLLTKQSKEHSEVHMTVVANEDSGSEGLVEGLDEANRAMRSASWVSAFYLITTDILGPTSAPYAISQLGYVPGTLIYFLFGIVAAYTGWIIWKTFLALDSYKYPLRNYGDASGRLFGNFARYFCDGLLALQLVCNVAVVILSNGQGLSQIAAGRDGTKNVCFSVLVVIWAFAGMIIGQIRSLQRFGFLANTAVYMNLFVCIGTMAVAANSAPNYSGAFTQNGVTKGPVVTKAVISGGGGKLTYQLQACMNIVYSYGGSMVFINFMAEMRRPWDFWKGMFAAEAFIFGIYLTYGLVVYSYQGQFVINPANQGISDYNWQTALNVVNMVSALIAAGLYGNVGIKVLYSTFIQRLIKGPRFETKKGRVIWFSMVLIYWATAFIIASAIPQFSSLTALVGALCILQFTYTIPPLIKLGYDMQIAAMEADGPYDPVLKQHHRIDNWNNLSRWRRAYAKNWALNTCNIILFLAALATAVLGCYSSIKNIIAAYQSNSSTSFGCKSPV